MDQSKIYQAINEGKEDDALTLLADPENEEELKLRDVNGRTLFHIAVKKIKSVNMFKELLKKVDFTIRDEDGQSAIEIALEDEEFPDEVEDAVKEFLREKAENSSKAELEWMIMRGWLNWLDLWTPDTEKLGDDKDDVKELVKTLPEKAEKVSNLHNAVTDSKWDVVKEMLEDKTLLGAADKTGLPPLQKAVILGETDIVENIAKEFVEALTCTDNMGRTALHYAAGRRDGGQLYTILKDAGAQEDTQDVNGRTPKEIFDDPDLLPNERTTERLQANLAKPAQISKRRKQVQAEQQTDQSSTSPAPAEKPPTPTRPASQGEQKPKPVQMYISPDVRKNPPPTTVDGRYVAEHLGAALTKALAEIAERRPWDPIEYLAQWLYKYHENTLNNQRQKELLAQIREEEAARELDREIKEKRRQELARIQEEERRKQQQEEEERKRKEQEELQRKAKEAALSQQPGLETVKEDEEEDEAPPHDRGERSHKDSEGRTELHKLAAQPDTDLTTLLNMDYNPAERDSENKTARDIAVENKIRENVEAIDKYVLKLVEMEEFDKVRGLLIAGYDKFDAVVDKLNEAQHSLAEDTKQFLHEIPVLQSQITKVFEAVQKEGLEDLTAVLENKKLAQAKDIQGRSPLHIAVLVGHTEAAEHLAKNFPTVTRCKDNLDRTPLHYAMALSENMASLLEKYGADTLAQDVRQHPPSYYKENPDDIKSMAGSFSSSFTGTQQQAESEPSQQEATQEEPAQQEAS